MKDCIFCKIVSGEIPDYRVWENERFIAFLDLRPLEEGHTLIVPKSHVEYLFDLPSDLYAELFVAAQVLAPVIQKITGCKKVGLAVEGFGVPHVHLHVIPMQGIHGLDPNKAHEVPKENLQEMQEKLIKELEK